MPSGLASKPISALLRRVDVLVLVDDQVAQVGRDLRVDLRVLRALDGADDLGAERHEPVARRASRSTRAPTALKSPSGSALDVDQLVLDDVDALAGTSSMPLNSFPLAEAA